MTTSVFAFIRKYLDEDIEKQSEAVIRGQLEYGEYKRVCGVIFGLKLARDTVMDVEKKLESGDDE
jgi:hypothetical protein